MAQSFTQLFYHLVWSTRQREPRLTAEMRCTVAAAIRTKAAEAKATVHAINGVADHLHVAVRLPPTVAIADFVESIKGYSAWLVNHTPDLPDRLRWQTGYGAVTFRKSELATVVGYIQNQEARHGKGSVWEEFERCEE